MAMVIDKAQVSLPSDGEVRVTRSFRGPRALVFRAYTEPDLVRQWMLGPPGWVMPVCEMDLRVGGRYRWRWRSEEDGNEFGFFGVFREVEPPSRIVHTETYDPGTLGDAMSADEAQHGARDRNDGRHGAELPAAGSAARGDASRLNSRWRSARQVWRSSRGYLRRGSSAPRSLSASDPKEPDDSAFARAV